MKLGNISTQAKILERRGKAEGIRGKESVKISLIHWGVAERENKNQ